MAKKLLKEATVRRFQRLANVAPINEMYHKRDEEEKMEEAYMEGEGEEVMKEEEEEAPELDMDMGGKEDDMDMGGEEGAMDGDLELTDEEAQAIIDLGNKLQGAMGDEPEMKMDDEEPMDMDKEDDGEELMEALAGIEYVPSQSEVVNEVAKRVARRLKEAKLHEAKLNRALGKRR